MDQVVKRSEITPKKSRLAGAVAKLLNVRAVAKSSYPGDDFRKTKSFAKDKQDRAFDGLQQKLLDEENEEKIRQRAAMEALLARLFASVSAVKAAYAQLQFSQSPYDAEGIQTADSIIVSELKNLSEFKQSFLKKHLDDDDPETTELLAEVREQKSLLKTYEITVKKLDSQVKLKNSEITFLKEKFEDINRENKLVEKRLRSSGQLSSSSSSPSSPFENFQFSALSPAHFVAALKQATKSVRNYVRFMTCEMEAAGWDLDAASSAIQPGIVYSDPNHICFAFESFVCQEMFDGFDCPNFSVLDEELPVKEKQRLWFFDRFMELKALKPKEYIAWKPNSVFAKFCWSKYLRLVHPKLESSLFDNLSQRNLVKAETYPDTAFFAVFAEMAKRVWLLHCLAYSFEQEASIFQVSKGCRFSEVFMDSVNEEPFSSTEPQVAFTVFPGFKLAKTVIQAQVYLNQPQVR